MHILIAEDDTTSRILLTGVLTKLGHDVTTAIDGAAAWDILQRRDAPALAILDWMMPGMDGLEVVQRTRALEAAQRPYLIMLSARADKSDMIAGLEAGADDYLSKPFHAGELKARVEVGCRVIDMQQVLAIRLEQLQEAHDRIKTLRGIIPICACCKMIRTDGGYWEQVEHFVQDHTEAEFTHGICPTCITTHYPEVAASSSKDRPDN